MGKLFAENVNSIKCNKPLRIAVLVSFSGAGGVERMVMNLVREFVGQCEALDLLVIRDNSPHLSNIPENVRLIKLNASHTLTAIPEITRYLNQEKPQVMLVAKDRAGRAAIFSRAFSKVNTKVVIRLGTNLSTALLQRSKLSAWWRTAPMKVIYKYADKIVAVSEGVAKDVINITGIPHHKVCVIRNPVITKRLRSESLYSPPHPWLENKELPVIMGIGRLSKQKDFNTLIHAFFRFNQIKKSRLIILGDGAFRGVLESLVASLGLSDNILMPGFQEYPASWLRYADLFVLSSQWEGSPNALTEALALGVPCVSTRCPSGPDEILHDGKFGELVEVGDSEAMAQAMLRTLNNRPDSAYLQSAVKEYDAVLSAANYMTLFKEL